MIAALAFALHHLAEQVVLVLAALGWGAGLSARTRRVAPVLWGAALVLAGCAAAFRGEKARLGVFDYPWAEWGGFVAIYEAAGAQVLWFGAGAVALAASLRVGSTRWAIPRALPPLVAAGTCAVGGWWAPHLEWCALVWLAVALDARSGAPWRRLVLTGALASVSTAFGALASIGWIAILVDPRHVVHLDAAAGVAFVVIPLAASLFAASGVLARFTPRSVRGALAAILLGVTVDVGFLARGLAHGPTADLAPFARALPLHVPRRAARVPGGCVVDRAGARHTVGALVDFDRVRPCPAAAAFPADDVPLLALPPDAAIDLLAGWHGAAAGDVALLTRLDASRWLVPWRVNAEVIRVSPSPTPEGSGLPGAVLCYREDGTLLAAAADGVRPLDRVAASVPIGGARRADVLLHASAVPTVRDLLDACAAVWGRAPDARCGLVFGDVERWKALLRAVDAPPFIEAAWESREGEAANF